MTESSDGMILNALPDGAVIADGQGVITHVNRVAAAMLGADPDDVLGGLLSDAFNLRDSAGRRWCEVNRPFDGLATQVGVPEQVWLLPDGGEVLVAARLHRPVPLAPISRLAITMRSGRGRARLDRERSDLVATVAHELRSPLTGVKGFVQALLNRWDRLTDEQKRLMLTTVSVDADRLSRLIAELLDVARIDTGRLVLSPRPTDVEVIVGRVVESVRHTTARLIVTELGDDLPAIWFDPDKFTQVLTNLVENAVRHGAGIVSVRAERVTVDDGVGRPGWVRVIVDDEGEGIAADLRRRVFTKFWTHGSRGGSGLGMYIVHGLVRAHGGSVSVGDAPTGGARIMLVLPSGSGLDDPV